MVYKHQIILTNFFYNRNYFGLTAADVVCTRLKTHSSCDGLKKRIVDIINGQLDSYQ